MKKELRKFCALFLLASFISINNFSLSACAETTAPANEIKPVSQIQIKSQVEHLPSYDKTEINTVNITSKKATISQGNVIKIAFAQSFSSKTAKVGDKVDFILKEDLKTEEGRVLLPATTKIIATVKEVIPTKIWNRNAQVLLSIGDIVLPDGTTGTISAQVHSKNATLKRSSWAAVGKASLWTVGLFGIGAGVGAAIGAAADAVGTGCLAIGMPVGGGLGLILGSVTKGLNYKAKPGKTIYIELTQDLDICY